MFQHSFLDYFSAFSAGSLWNKGFSTERRAVRSFNFRDFYRDFMGLPGFYGGKRAGCVGRFLMRTLFYRLTSKRKHLPLPKNAIKENGFILASLTSCYFHFLCFYHPDCFLHKQKVSSATYENRRERKLPFSDFWSSFFTSFKNSAKHLRHSNT